MNVVSVYARLYADCLGKTFTGIRKNAWTLLLPMGLVFVAGLGGVVFGGLLGPLAGIALTVGLVTFIPTKEKLSAAAFAGGSLLLVLVAGRKARQTPA